jgi:hypothetical protein
MYNANIMRAIDVKFKSQLLLIKKAAELIGNMRAIKDIQEGH